MCRAIINYSHNHKQILKFDCDSVLSNIKALELRSISRIFPNQLDTAKEIYDNFQNRNILNQFVAGRTQSGKTGLILAVIKLFLENYELPPENIFILTSLSSIEWGCQNKERMVIMCFIVMN